MSKNYWQIKKQIEPLRHSGTTAGKLKAWEAEWRKRCYSGGIPDEVPDLLLYSGRVPSWRAAAMAILRNDLVLRSLGFSGKHTHYASMLDEAWRRENDTQLDLFP